MGQSASIESAAPASQQMSNVLPAGVTSNVRVQCVEASNATLEKLQAVMRDGCDAAALNALSSKTFDTTSDATVAQVQNFLAPPPTDADAADAKPLYLFAIRKAAKLSKTASEEEASGLVPLPQEITLAQLVQTDECVTFTSDDVTSVLVLYTTENIFGIDGSTCCLVACCAAICACCAGILCCCCNSGE